MICIPFGLKIEFYTRRSRFYYKKWLSGRKPFIVVTLYALIESYQVYVPTCQLLNENNNIVLPGNRLSGSRDVE